MMVQPLRLLCVVLVTTLSFPVAAQSEPPQLSAVANNHARAGRWDEACEAYAQVVEINPYRGATWHNYGNALLQAKRYRESAEAYRRAQTIGFFPHRAFYNELCALALAGATDEALDRLEAKLAAGFTDPTGSMLTDSDLASLHEHPRFRALLHLDAESGLSRDDQWRRDIELLASEMRRIHPNLFWKTDEAQFDAAHAHLLQRVPSLADHEIVVEIQRLVALVGDGHSITFFGTHDSFGREQLPVVMYVYAEGLYINAIEQPHAALAGGRVVRIGTMAADDALAAVAPLVSHDNELWIDRMAPPYMRRLELLHAVGVSESTDSVTLVVQTPEGATREATLTPRPRNTPLVQAYHDATAPLPLRLQRSDRNYWFEPLPEYDAVYMNFRASSDQGDESIGDFANRMFDYIDEHDVQHLIIDMRLNGGGNNNQNTPLTERIMRHPRMSQRGHLHVINGRNTFSAAMNFVADLEMNADPIFVGEPTGSAPNQYGDARNIDLPNTGLRVRCASLYWQRGWAYDLRWWIAPDVVAPMTPEAFRTNRDPALEAIFDYLGG